MEDLRNVNSSATEEDTGQFCAQGEGTCARDGGKDFHSYSAGLSEFTVGTIWEG